MFFDILNNQSYTHYTERRKKLAELVLGAYPTVQKGVILIAADIEHARYPFVQDSTFFYLTGLQEPGLYVALDLSGEAIVLVPQFTSDRTRWVESELAAITEQPEAYGFAGASELGTPMPGYQVTHGLPAEHYSTMLETLHAMKQDGYTMFVANDALTHIPCSKLFEQIIDVAPIVAMMRRKKDALELTAITDAAALTTETIAATAQQIQIGSLEVELAGYISLLLTASGSSQAFPTIVASGKASTVLHATPSMKPLEDGDLVIIDCGATSGNYCADISRTLPVSGSFTERQRDVYTKVLEAQLYLASIAQAGFYLSNDNHPDTSLQHLLKKYLAKHNLDTYIVHGVGHFIGLDVHDVGNSKEPLIEGDIITLEPGVYIPEEHIGIRIEDMYLVGKKGLICLSEELPKTADDIEALIRGELTSLDQDDTEDHDECSDTCCNC